MRLPVRRTGDPGLRSLHEPLGNADMQPSQDAGSRRESDIIHETLQGQHRLSQPRDCRVTFQALMESVKSSAEKAKSVHCRSPNAGRLMAETTWMTDLPTVGQQAVPTRLGLHTQGRGPDQ